MGRALSTCPKRPAPAVLSSSAPTSSGAKAKKGTGDLFMEFRRRINHLSPFFLVFFISLGYFAHASASNTSWTFAVSGDSRDCGDVVMPAIAAGVQKHGAQFYWHLGDLRKIYDFDEDM